jgi:hypothetical protein
MEDRFILQASNKPNHWVCTDKANGIVCVFEAHKLNETQQFTDLEDAKNPDVSAGARIMREMGDFLYHNHYDKIF